MIATFLCMSPSVAAGFQATFVKGTTSRAFGLVSKIPQIEKKFSASTNFRSRSSLVAAATVDKVAEYDILNKERGLQTYTPSEFENQVYSWWEESGCFDPDAKRKASGQTDDKEPYVLPMPPPNVTGRLHMGHAIFVALQDILARYHRMRGRPVLWLPGKFLKSMCA